MTRSSSPRSSVSRSTPGLEIEHPCTDLSFFWSDVTVAGAWTGQAVWISLAALPVYLVNAIPKARQPRLGLLDLIGVAIWAGAWGIELLADKQKSQWRQERTEKKHDEKFIKRGLWAWSRHPK